MLRNAPQIYNITKTARTNFRKKRFNDDIDAVASQIYLSLKSDHDQDYPAQQIGDFYTLLENYYRFDRQKDYKNTKDAIERTKEVYSEFIQNLIYYICHNTLNISNLNVY